MRPRLSSVSSFLLPKLGDILFLAGFASAILLGPRLLNVDGDLGRHLVIGNLILDTGKIPTQDLFSHTMSGEPLTPHEWLSEVIFSLFYRWMGLNGVVFLSGLLLAFTFRTLYENVLKRCGRPLLCLALCLAAMAVSSLHWLARPHLFTLLFLAIWLGELERLFIGNTSRWWSLPLLMLFWANLHGAFIAGFVTWGIYLVGYGWDHARRRDINPGILKFSLAAGALSFGASLINPAGVRLWGTSLGYLQNQYLVGHTAEYLSPDFHLTSAWPFLIMLVLAIVAFGLKKSPLSSSHVFSIAAWAGMGLVSMRNIPLFGIVAVYGLAEALSGESASEPGLETRLMAMEKRLAGWTWSAAIILLVIFAYGRGAYLDAQQKGNQFDPQVFPVAAVNWLDDHFLAGEGFNYFPWGGYLLFREWPGRKVFIDGQTDFYGEALTRDYEKVITAAPGWQAILNRYGVSWILIPDKIELSKTLDQSTDWSQVYHDSTSSIYVHTH